MTKTKKSSKSVLNQVSTIIKKHSLQITIFLLFLGLLSLFPYPNKYFKPIAQTKGIEVIQAPSLPTPPNYPLSRTNMPPPSISAEGVLIKDLDSGAVIYSKQSKVKFSPASTTKIMTALIALQNFQLEDILKVKTVIKESRVMGLISGEEITLESLLYGILVHSANDAAFVVAENYDGGVEGFVERMNQEAKKLHLENTHFSNPIGFDNEVQYTTAEDLAKLSQVALKNKIFSKIVGTKSITVSDVHFKYFHELTNVNRLLGKIPGMSGVKTGYTQNAGEVLVSEVKKYGHPVLFVILKSQDRFAETVKLIDWVFANFTWTPIEEIIPPEN